MKFIIVNLTEKNLKNVPEWESYPFGCKYCIYWEFPEECVMMTKENKEDMLQKKLGWLRNTTKVFGDCGKIMYVDDKVVAYAQYAPPELLPNSYNYKSGPSSKNAVLISCLFIPQEKFRSFGLGSKLLQSIIDDLTKREMQAVETFARKSSDNNPSGPVALYLKYGFRVYKDAEEFPLMRLEL